MKFILFITFSLLPICKLYSQWELIAQSDFALWDVAFINSDTGFIAGEDENNYSNFSSHYGIILRTRDGGETWDTTILNTPVYSIYFIDKDTGFVGSDDNYIYKTTNSGNTWESLHMQCNFPLYIAIKIQSMFFSDSNNGFMSSTYYGEWFTLKTNDGCSTVIPINADSINNFWGQFSFPNDSIGYIGTRGKTYNRGQTWNYTYNDILSPFPASSETRRIIDYHSENYGMSAGWGEFVPNALDWWAGIIGITHDAGIHWSYQYFPTIAKFYSIKVIDENISYAAGTNLSYISSGFLKTIDGGEKWYYQKILPDSITFTWINSLCFLNKDTAYAVGRMGQIFKTTNGGGELFGIPEVTKINEIETQELAFKVFPNPAHNFFYVSNRKHGLNKKYVLKIYTLEGRLSMTKEINSLSDVNKVDCKTLKPGLYLIHLIADEEQFTSKILLQ